MTWLLVLMACVDGGKDGGTKGEEPRDTAETSTDTHDGGDSGETDTTSGSSATLTGDGAFTAASLLFWYNHQEWEEYAEGPEILIAEWDQNCDFNYFAGDPSLEGEGGFVYILGSVNCNDGVDDGSPEWGRCNDSVPVEGEYDHTSVNECSELDWTETCRAVTLARVGIATGPAEDGGWTMGEFTDSTDAEMTLTRYTNDGAEGSFRIDGLEGTFTSVTNCGPSEESE